MKLKLNRDEIETFLKSKKDFRSQNAPAPGVAARRSAQPATAAQGPAVQPERCRRGPEG